MSEYHALHNMCICDHVNSNNSMRSCAYGNLSHLQNDREESPHKPLRCRPHQLLACQFHRRYVRRQLLCRGVLSQWQAPQVSQSFAHTISWSHKRIYMKLGETHQTHTAADDVSRLWCCVYERWHSVKDSNTVFEHFSYLCRILRQHPQCHAFCVGRRCEIPQITFEMTNVMRHPPRTAGTVATCGISHAKPSQSQ